MDPDYKAALELLFGYYIAEDFYEEQWGTAGDLTADFLEYATKGFNHVRDTVEKRLEFDLTFEFTDRENPNASWPESETVVAERMLLVLNGHENKEQLIEAAKKVWNRYMEPRESSFRLEVYTALNLDVMTSISREFKGRVVNRYYPVNADDYTLPRYVLEFPSEASARAYLYNYSETIKETK